MALPSPQKIWTHMRGSFDPIERIERYNQKIRDREIDELETLLMLTHESDAPEDPTIWDPATQRAFFTGMVWGVGITLYFAVYATGILHV